LRSPIVVCCLLVIATFALYFPTLQYGFINYDDPDYVEHNAHISAGLSADTFVWAFRATEQSNWHPLTWLSHALDCELFGLDAGAHHRTNVALHALNGCLLFLALRRLTGAQWRGLLVALLFTVHPVNVETVAWIAERKSLLSSIFFFLALWTYAVYAARTNWRSTALLALLFALGLMAKPMVITLPCVLLLLDYWPLRRLTQNVSEQASRPSLISLLVKKLPLFALAGASACTTIYSQSKGAALRSLERIPFDLRVKNALYSYAIYLEKLFWPAGLALPYPHPGSGLAFRRVALATMILLALSALAWTARRTQPHLVTGWLWFLGMLVPVIGIVQVGRQGMADRYLYLPMIGIAIMTVWGADTIADHMRLGFALRAASAAAVVLILAAVTWTQVGYWRSSETLWQHTLEVTHDNAVAEDQLGMALLTSGRHDEAFEHFQRAAQIDPTDATSHLNLGAFYSEKGDARNAIPMYEKALEWTADAPTRVLLYTDLGFANVSLGQYEEAQRYLHLAREGNPQQMDATIQKLQEFLASHPNPHDYVKLGLLLRDAGRSDEAQQALDAAKSLTSGSTNAPGSRP
jgi:tetratricopeptide (TPR) repeat protein